MITRRLFALPVVGVALLHGLGFWSTRQVSAQVSVPERYDVLPDGEVSRHGSFSARLIDPTERYDHGVLGDAIEAGGFMVE
ncbi:MAG: hypothetical protein ACRCUE_15635, partial [Bosea sp. (in: a-proteobacteria)]